VREARGHLLRGPRSEAVFRTRRGRGFLTPGQEIRKNAQRGAWLVGCKKVVFDGNQKLRKGEGGHKRHYAMWGKLPLGGPRGGKKKTMTEKKGGRSGEGSAKGALIAKRGGPSVTVLEGPATDGPVFKSSRSWTG